MSEHDAVIERIGARGREIGDRAAIGDRLAANIVKLYTMYYRRPENGSLGLLMAALDEWEESHG